MDPDWLRWVKRLQAIAQDGLTYARDGYDLGRYEQLRELAAEILAAHSTGSIERPRELLELETGPATPKVDVRAAFRGGRILLVKESDDGGWAVPGGWAHVGESAAEGAVREVYEEADYRVRAVRLISAYDRDRHNHPSIPYHVYKLVFLCEILGEPVSLDVEADGVGFFGEHEPPELSLSRVTRAQVRRFFEHHRRGNLPSDFDCISGEHPELLQERNAIPLPHRFMMIPTSAQSTSMPAIPMCPTVGATPIKATLWVPAAVHRVATLPPVASYGRGLGHGVEVGETSEECGDASLVWPGSVGWSARLRSR